MTSKKLLALAIFVASFTFLAPTHAKTDITQIEDKFYRATVTKIDTEGMENVDGQEQYHQVVELVINNGDKKGTHITIDHGGSSAIAEYQKVKQGEHVIVTASLAEDKNGSQQELYYIIDHDRSTGLILVCAIFFGLAIFFGRMRGFTSIIGMLVSVGVIFYGIIPRIMAGNDVFTVCVVGAIAIIIVSLYLSHGFNRRTTIALAATLIALVAAIGIDLAFVHIAHLAGNGTEEALYLQTDTFTINLQGLLLGAIIIGVLGVLDDVTTGQAAAVEEIHAANPSQRFTQLYKSGLSVGREHIASLINTLVLAYVGATFPLLILYATQSKQPLWVTLTSSFIGEELVRTLVGSTVLVLAVPLTTFIAAYWYTRRHDREKL